MRTIQRLPLPLSNQIAAGEVIERPASVVKELVENSLDADARSIRIEVRDGGKSIRITDDGTGISPEDAPLAFERFATSKLKSFDDLYQLETMGFRGEALASIAAVARVDLTTRRRESEEGTKVRIDEGGMKISPCGCPEGTTIFVQDLFYGTPARLKFLKSPATEHANIQDTVIALALANPRVGFSLTVQDREILNTFGCQNLKDAACALFAEGKKMVFVEAFDDLIRIEGLCSPPDLFRADRQKQWFFINGRWIRHPAIQKAAESCYLGQLPSNRFPFLILSLRLDPERLDVNVHPNKREVRMNTPQGLFTLVKEAVTQAIYSKKLLNNFQAEEFKNEEEKIKEKIYSSDWQPEKREKRNENFSAPQRIIEKFAALDRLPERIIEKAYAPDRQPERKIEKFPWEELKLLGQLHRTYLLLEHPEGLYLIDQHNSHERVLFEDLAPAVLERQELLLPVSLRLDASQSAFLDEERDLFFDLGFEIEKNEKIEYLVRCAPAILPYSEIEETILELIGGEGRGMGQEERWRAQIACKAAIKAGETLSMERMGQLLARLKNCPQPLTCPHGRPTGFLLSLGELHRRVLR
ncbi:MAG TPA: DNA mismatch repair endonuclease MutL [Chroococcales cyanobacterium]